MPVRILLLTLAIMGSTSIAWAQQEPSLIPPTGTLQGGAAECSFITGDFHFDCIPLYIGYLVQVIFAVSGMFALLEVMLAGYQIAMGGLTGDKEKGKQRLTWSLIGLAVCILAFVIVDWIVTVLVTGP